MKWCKDWMNGKARKRERERERADLVKVQLPDQNLNKFPFRFCTGLEAESVRSNFRVLLFEPLSFYLFRFLFLPFTKFLLWFLSLPVHGHCSASGDVYVGQNKTWLYGQSKSSESFKSSCCHGKFFFIEFHHTHMTHEHHLLFFEIFFPLFFTI